MLRPCGLWNGENAEMNAKMLQHLRIAFVLAELSSVFLVLESYHGYANGVIRQP